MEELLPVGSVVKTNKSNKKLVVIGYLPVDDSGNLHDYVCTVAPLGAVKNIGSSEFNKDYFYINNSEISFVLFMGYIDNSFYLLKECIDIMKRKKNEGLTSVTMDDVNSIVDEVKQKMNGGNINEE